MIDVGKQLQDAYDEGYAQRDVEIVRCKNCCYWLGVQEEHALCSVHDNIYVVTPRDGYCFKGRRSE